MLFRKTSGVVLALLMVLGVATAQKAPNGPKKTTASSVAGDWLGTLEEGGQKLRLALHIKQAADGALSATMDSLDQGVNGIAIDKISFQNGKLSFSSNAVHGTYEGKLTAGSTIEGTWSQGQPLPLNFKRAK
ncbi:MAG TPA: hypothetical protein VFP71_02335 [Candidatus Angelobacter sp.]|nr:hypothetical protein [Candidatus Angelobacter sp.]